MLHFVMSRHALYRQVYQHRVLLASDALSRTIVERARSVKLKFADSTMTKALNATSYKDLSLEDINNMRESWWRYHIHQWIKEDDAILAELSNRLINRRLFKTVRLQESDNLDELSSHAKKAVEQAGFDPTYYLHIASAKDVHKGDKKHSMSVLTEEGKKKSLKECEEIFEVLVNESKQYGTWLIMPKEAKILLGRSR